MLLCTHFTTISRILLCFFGWLIVALCVRALDGGGGWDSCTGNVSKHTSDIFPCRFSSIVLVCVHRACMRALFTECMVRVWWCMCVKNSAVFSISRTRRPNKQFLFLSQFFQNVCNFHRNISPIFPDQSHSLAVFQKKISRKCKINVFCTGSTGFILRSRIRAY